MITRRVSWILLSAVLLAGAVPLRASSIPVIQGAVAGVELCEQAVCGSAIFVGFFGGQVDQNSHALGVIAVAVNHDPLPAPYAAADITGGLWQLQLISGRKVGGVVTGGSLYNNGDGTFGVTADMLLLTGGTPGGTLTFEGTLSHNTFPPTIRGMIEP